MSKPLELFLTDMGNAERFVRRHGNVFRWCGPLGCWLHYDGRRWARDEAAKAVAAAQEAARSLWTMIDNVDPEMRKQFIAHALYSEKARGVGATLEMAKPMLAVVPADLDRDAWALNVNNGTINLRTGEIRPHDPADLITKLAPVDFDGLDAECPRWDAFMDRITDGNREIVQYHQRIAGLCITGDASVQEMFIFHGSGANGKSVELDTWTAMLGDYAGAAANSLLTVGRHEHPTELMDLCGRRLVVASETEEGAELKVQLVKQLTGNATIKARAMRQDYVEFPRSHKLVMVTNNRPVVRETTHAVWRRLRLVPFNVTIPAEERDPQLIEKLRAEWPGILAWMVLGCLDWQRAGMATPAEVLIATENYQHEQDGLTDYLAERTLRGAAFRVSRADLFNDYTAYAAKQGDRHPLDRNSFFDRIRRIPGVAEGQPRINGAVTRVFVGIGLSFSSSATGATCDPD